MRILSIDPGPEKSAYVLWDAVKPGFIAKSRLIAAAEMPNHQLKSGLPQEATRGARLAVEMVACYGMPVGAETFETCLWIGRFVETWEAVAMPDRPAQLVYRKDVKMHLCNSMRAKDANIRQAILDRFGGKESAMGKKASPGPLYGVSGHLWAALAVALTVADKEATQ